MDRKRIIVYFSGLFAAFAVLAIAAIAFNDSGDGSEPSDQARNEDTSGGGALGVCVEGVPDCVDTIVRPDGDEPSPDEPVSSGPAAGDTPNSGDLVDPDDCSAAHNIEPCRARATELAVKDLSGRLAVDSTAIAVVSIEDAIWDGCMGIAPSEGQACTEIGILGYKIILKHAGVTYEYHTDQGSKAVLAE